MRAALRVVPFLLLLAAACAEKAEAPWLTMPSAAAHAKHFGIAPGDTHGPAAGQGATNCNACHAVKTSATSSEPSDTFKVFTCTNCHGVTLKSGVPHDGDPAAFRTWHVSSAGVNAVTFDATVATANTLGYDRRVAALDIACYTCHRSGIGVDHASRFILPHQNAAGTVVALCSSCHVVPGNRKQLGCSACHPHSTAANDAAHATLVPGYLRTNAVAADVQVSSLLCARCHEDGKIPVRVAAHAAGARGFTVGTGKHAGAAGGACLTCHDQNRTTPPRTFVADFKKTTCVGCHVTVGGSPAFHDDATGLGTIHAGEPAFATTVATLGLSAACLSCHADGQGGAPSNHELIFPRALGTPHGGIGCSECHGNGPRTDLAALACVSCHVTGPLPPPLTLARFNTAHRAPFNHTSTGRTGDVVHFTRLDLTSPVVCLRCHAPTAFNGPTTIIPIRIIVHAHDDSSINTLKHKDVGCVDCHQNTRVVEGRYTAQDFDSDRRNCLLCHESNNP